jgi:hypothetical protein
MTLAYDYIGRRSAQAHAEEIELDRVRGDIAGMEAQLEKLTSNLAAARLYAGVLSTSIAMAQQLVEDQCQRNDWPLPEPVEPDPVPSPIERSARVSVDTGPERTTAFKAITVAQPVAGEGGGIVCGQSECGLELVHENGVFIHTATGMQMCEDEPSALQEGTDGSPLLTTVLPPHGVEVTREDA